jgi:MFS family permease
VTGSARTLVERGVRLSASTWWPPAALVTGQTISTAGTQMSDIAFIWLVVRLTGSVGDLSLIMIAAIAPSVVFSALGGVLVDRLISPAALLISADLGRAAVMLGLAVLVRSGHTSLPWLAGAAVALSVGQAIFDPSLRTAAAAVAGKNSLLRLNSALQITNRTCGIIFPVLAGILIAILGVWMMLAIDGLTFIVSAASVALARLPRKTAGERVRSSIWSDLTAGIAYVMRQAYVRWIILAAAVINLADALVVVYPLFVRNVLHKSVIWYGLLSSAVMVGLLAVMVANLIGGRRIPPRPMLVGGAGIQGIGLLLAALTRSPEFSLVGFVLFGTGMGAFATTAVTLLQQTSPRAALGRVLGLYGTVALVLSPVGYALASVVSDAVGLAGVIGIAGAIMAVTAVGLLVFLKSVPVPDEQHETG